MCWNYGSKWFVKPEILEELELVKKVCVFYNMPMILFFFLMGRKKSLKSALDLLYQFSKFSGLKPNISKAKAIWIGSKAQSADTLRNDSGILWTTEPFNILGIIYTANLCNIVQLNFADILHLTKSCNHISPLSLEFWLGIKRVPDLFINVLMTYQIIDSFANLSGKQT